jgi:hypothetical protein
MNAEAAPRVGGGLHNVERDKFPDQRVPGE